MLNATTAWLCSELIQQPRGYAVSLFNNRVVMQ